MDLPEKTLAIVLAGGAGTRLHPLTLDRAKPAVPFGGIYRIIDFTLSNCLHSGFRQVLVLTQYKSHSLQKHLRDGWAIFNPEIGEYITTVPAQMRLGEGWYAGTADAINQNRYLLERSHAEYVMVLAGDHIYRMDYIRMIEEHILRKWDVTLACVPVPLSESRSFGVVEVSGDRVVKRFVEKSNNPPSIPGDHTRALASMGIYVFNLPFLLEILGPEQGAATRRNDFGKDILPEIVASHTIGVYRFGVEVGRVEHDGYWRDVGTLDAYYEANMDLLKPIPPLNLYQRSWPIRTYHGQYPPARNVPSASGDLGSVTNTLLAGGDVVIGADITHSILSPNVWVESGAVVEDSILFEGVHIGADTRLRGCIVDKGVQIPPKEAIGFDPDIDRRRFVLSDNGVVVIPKGYRFDTISEETE